MDGKFGKLFILLDITGVEKYNRFLTSAIVKGGKFLSKTLNMD